MLRHPARRRSGFTLIELMIAVGLLGLVCALAIPAYVHRARIVRTAEAAGRLRDLYAGAVNFYGVEHFHCRMISGDFVDTHCTVPSVSWAPEPTRPYDPNDRRWYQRGVPDAFAILDFHDEEPTDLLFAITGSTGRCDIEPNTAIYTFRAAGDLDADGARSTFELAAGSDASGEMYRSPGIYVVDPLE